MWRDESQAWLLAIHQNHWGEVFAALHFEGHPSLWYVILRLSSWAWNDIRMMQIVSAVFTSATTFLLLSEPRLSRIEKVLLIFNYYFFFEFGLISRSYVLEAFLFVFLVTRVLGFRTFQSWMPGLILGFLSNTHLDGVFLSCGIAIYLILSGDRSFRKWPNVVLFTMGIGFAAYSMLPAPTIEFGPRIIRPFDLDFFIQSVIRFFGSFIPIAKGGVHFWNSLLLFAFPHWLQLGLVIVVAMLIWMALPVTWYSRIAAAFVFFAILSSLYFLGLINLRYMGPAFMFLLAMRILDANSYSGAARLAFIILLLTQAIAGLQAQLISLKYPFSRARDAAEYVSSLNNPRIVGDSDFEVAALLGYLDTPIYFLRSGKTSWYIQWDKFRNKSGAERRDLFEDYSKLDKRPFVVVLSWNESEVLPVVTRMKILNEREFEPGVIEDEGYRVFLVQPSMN